MNVSNSRAALEKLQLKRLRGMLRAVLPSNQFYRRKFAGIDCGRIHSAKQFRRLPFTTKQELVDDQSDHPPFGTNLTAAPERYIRIHQTSGTTGRPMYWLDTEESWNWWAACWKVIFEAAGIGAADRIYFAFSFGPFIGFWAGWEGARKLGALAISGGAQSTIQRIKSIIDHGVTVLVSTPTYALHLASEARKAGIDLARDSAVKTTIHAGEPGASIPGTKKLIEASWGAQCYDHAGATEVGAFGFQCRFQSGAMHVNEDEFIVEVIDLRTGTQVEPETAGELVITNLGRIGSPVVRYRTGDLVQPSTQPCPCGSPFILLDGGILGRVDDMVIIKGVNVFPSALESVLRGFTEIEEFRIETFERESIRQLKLIIEPAADRDPAPDLREKISAAVRERIGLRPEIELVAAGGLPRFELKAKRFFKLS